MKRRKIENPGDCFHFGNSRSNCFQNGNSCCGGCSLFEDENADGTGVCLFHQQVFECDSEACEDYIGKKND